MNKPRLIISSERNGLDRTTYESRREMTVAELIAAMGPLHVNHPDFKPRPRTLLPMPNLADVQPMIEFCDHNGFWRIKKLLHWISR